MEWTKTVKLLYLRLHTTQILCTLIYIVSIFYHTKNHHGLKKSKNPQELNEKNEMKIDNKLKKKFKKNWKNEKKWKGFLYHVKHGGRYWCRESRTKWKLNFGLRWALSFHLSTYLLCTFLTTHVQKIGLILCFLIL